MNKIRISVKCCELCGRDITKKKQDHHHVDYEKDVTLLLCYSCHQLMHGRPIYKNMNYWVKNFGKDKGFYELSKKFIEVYESKMKEVISK